MNEKEIPDEDLTNEEFDAEENLLAPEEKPAAQSIPEVDPDTLDGIKWQFKNEFDFAEGEEAPATEIEGDILSADSISETERTEEIPAAVEPTDDLPFEFVDTERFYSILESLLFSYDKPVSVSLMREAFRGTNIKAKDINKALDVLASRFAASERGVMLEEIAGGYQLRTKPDNAQFLLRMTKERPFKLTGPSLETLSIIAYKQPIVKSEIDHIRGVESGHLLRALMDRGLVSFQGKSELPGKPMQYGTTRKFLEIFGLRNLRELPSLAEIDQLIPEGIGDPIEEKQNLSDLTDEMSTELTNSYSEGESELMQITDQLSEIHTSSEFFENEKKREKEKRERERAEDIAEALMLGTPVDDKDAAWLKRFEAKQAEMIALEEERAKAGMESSGDTALEAASAPMSEEENEIIQAELDAIESSGTDESDDLGGEV